MPPRRTYNERRVRVHLTKKLDRSRSEGRGFMAKHHLYKIRAHTFKKRHVDVP